MFRSATFAMVAAVTFSSLLSAQQTLPDTVRVATARRLLQSDLRNFITAQEAFFADSATYATSLRQLGPMRYGSSFGVTVVLLTASKTSHSEIAIIDKVPGLVCATYVGTAPPPLGSGKEGEVICRGP